MGVYHFVGVHLLPMSAPVLRAVNSAGFVAGEHGVRVLGVDRQGPDIPGRRIQGFPMLPSVVTPVRARLGAGEDHCRVLRMDQ